MTTSPSPDARSIAASHSQLSSHEPRPEYVNTMGCSRVTVAARPGKLRSTRTNTRACVRNLRAITMCR